MEDAMGNTAEPLLRVKEVKPHKLEISGPGEHDPYVEIEWFDWGDGTKELRITTVLGCSMVIPGYLSGKHPMVCVRNDKK
jgi:hypothetical protein